MFYGVFWNLPVCPSIPPCICVQITSNFVSQTPPTVFLLLYGKFVNPLPYDKILDWSKFKAFADDKIYVTEKLKTGLGRVENMVGKGENAGYQHFLLFPQCFQKVSFLGSLKVGIVWERVNTSVIY